VQNVVPVPIEQAVADRAVAERRDQYAAEVRRLIDAAFAVMRRRGDVDPAVRDIVREAGLSNQAFYRHFASRDALLLAVLADGRQQLVGYLQARLATTADPREQVRHFIEGVMAQARDPEAADATRPFTINANRLAAQFPDEVAASRVQLLNLLRPAVHELGGDDRDVEIVHDIAIARMHDALVQRRLPDRSEVEHLVQFTMAGLTHGT
jgi:AcrR family transcriptional regulator